MRYPSISGLALLAALVGTPALAGNVAEPFEASRNPQTFERSVQCLTEAIYYEARSEAEDGQRAVAQVVLNRVRHPAYPNTVCGVVYQGAERTTGCQFSFTCTGVMGPIMEHAAWDRSRRIAIQALRGRVFRPVGLAVNYHTTAIRPYWAPSLVTQATVGAHIFYTRPDSRSVEAFNQMPANYEPDTFGRMRGERYEDVRVEQPVHAPRMRERFAPVQQRRVPGRDRYAPLQIAEIPIPAREIVYRTYGPRPTQRATPASSQNAARPAAQQEQSRRPARSGPRVVRQSNGIRIVYGN